MNWLTRRELMGSGLSALIAGLFGRALPPVLRDPSRQPQSLTTRARLSWEQGFTGFTNPFFKIPHTQNLYLLEQIPGLIPSVGSALRILTQLVGCPKVVSENKAAAEEANQWWETVNVNQTGTGGGIWHAGHVRDHLLYGMAFAEIIPTARNRDVFAIQALHPRTIELRPRAGYGVDFVQHGLFGQLIELDRDLTLATAHDYQQDHPWGCSILCDLPRVVQILNEMLESLKLTWERYGTPTYFVNYRPAKEISDPNGTIGGAVVASALSGLQDALAAKANGQSRDFGAAGEFDIQILGAEGAALNIEVPWRAIEEEIVSVFGLPAWMLGKHWSTTERLSIEQAKLIGEVVDEVRAHLIASVRYLFNLRQLLVGRPFEFDIEWDAPSLVDAQAEAQAEKTKAEALSATIKAHKELWGLGAETEFEFVRAVREDMKDKTDAQILRDLPNLMAMPPVMMSPFGGGSGQPGEEPPPREGLPMFRSLTYAGSWGGHRKNGTHS